MVYFGFGARLSRHDTSGTRTGADLKFDRFAGAIGTATLAPLGGLEGLSRAIRAGVFRDVASPSL